MTVHLPFLAFIVVLLIAFIIGWVIGASSGKSGESSEENKIGFGKSREVLIKLTEDQLTNRQRIDDKDIIDLTQCNPSTKIEIDWSKNKIPTNFERKSWKPPNRKEIDWGKVILDSEKRSKNKWK